MSRVSLVLSLAVIAGCSGGQTPPPFGVPITGGTILVTKAGQVVVSDPDRDRIAIVDLAAGAVVSELQLTAGDEPGRVIEDGAGRLHVALRRGGAILTLDAASGEVTARRYACAEPRGLAWEPATDAIHVACSGGELVTFRAAGGDAIRSLRLDRDLRDVVVSGDQLVVTRFRSAELLMIDANGAVVTRTALPPVFRFDASFPLPDAGSMQAFASTAWRAIPLADGRIVVSHQRAVDRVLGDDDNHQGGYGGSCNKGPVEAGLTLVAPGQAPLALSAMASGALPVDIAVSADGARLALVLAGQKTVTVRDAAITLAQPDREKCGDDDDDNDDDRDMGDDLGAPTSTAFARNGDLVIFYPEKPALVVRAVDGTKRMLALAGETSHDPGRAIFHAQTQLQIACASCHPEGRDDGRVWEFVQSGPRRTQSLAGDVLERAPFHWSGDMKTLDVLMDDVFTLRMSGGEVTAHQKVGLAQWLARIPAAAPGPVTDADAVARGQAIFASPEVGCATCHNGAQLTNKQLVDVGTGEPFKVPSLIGVGARAPFMHNGCAATLMGRFSSLFCGGGDLHGRTSQLTAAQLADLVAYLESL
jgi:mono/diheme cytochrome c family protein